MPKLRKANEFYPKELGLDVKEALWHTISPDSLVALIMDHLARGTHASVVRLGDTESFMMRAALGQVDPEDWETFKGPDRRKRLGLEDYPASIKSIGQALQRKVNAATYLGPNIAGFYYDQFRLHDMLPRAHYIDAFFPVFWHAKRRTECVLNNVNTAVVSRAAVDMIPIMSKMWMHNDLHPFVCASWHDFQTSMSQALNSDCRIVLVACGPYGKSELPEMAEQSGKIILDIGNAMYDWCGLNRSHGV